MSPLGEFEKEDIYCRKCENMCNTSQINFGAGGKRKFMQPLQLQVHHKWNKIV